jgi:excisionase family DNA binding protein
VETSSAIVRKQLQVDDVAELIGVSSRHVRNLIARGVLPHWRAGGRILIDPEKLRDWIDAGGTSPRSID